MRKSLVALAVALVLAGCATSINEAGNSGYSVTRATTADGKATAGYNLTVRDGKEYVARTVTFSATPAGSVTFTVSEQGSKAFRGQAQAVKALSLFPVTGLSDLLGE